MILPVPLLALGAVVGADRTAVGQTLLAHPGVAAPLAGWLAGAPEEGVWLGLALTLLTALHRPVGKERLRDHASVAVAIPAAVGPGAEAWAWGTGLVVGLLLAPAAALPILGLREYARRALVRARAEAEAGRVPPVEVVHFGLAGAHLLRGLATVGLLGLVVRGAILLVERAGPVEHEALNLFWVAAPVVGIPLLLRSRLRRHGWAWWTVGLVGGFLLVWWSGGGATWIR